MCTKISSFCYRVFIETFLNNCAFDDVTWSTKFRLFLHMFKAFTTCNISYVNSQ